MNPYLFYFAVAFVFYCLIRQRNMYLTEGYCGYYAPPSYYYYPSPYWNPLSTSGSRKFRFIRRYGW